MWTSLIVILERLINPSLMMVTRYNDLLNGVNEIFRKVESRRKMILKLSSGEIHNSGNRLIIRNLKRNTMETWKI